MGVVITKQELLDLHARFSAFNTDDNDAMAAASLVAPTGAGANSLAVGIGGYDGANSVALGYTRIINPSMSVKTVVAYGDESEFSYGASVGFNF